MLIQIWKLLIRISKSLSKIFFNFKICNVVYLIICLSPNIASSQAETSSSNISNLEPPHIIKLKKEWVFTGVATNENGENFSYYFQIQDNVSFRSFFIILVNNQTKEVLLFDKGSSPIDEEEKQPQNHSGDVEEDLQDLVSNNKISWHIGKAFLKFDPITNSWVFGVSQASFPNFNFKVDLLSQIEHKDKMQTDLQNVKVNIVKTGELNGHLQISKEQEFFVRAKSSWFGQTLVEKELTNPLITCFCQFDDGNSFYAIQLKTKESLQGPLAGWYNSDVLSLPISQFINLTAVKNNCWILDLNTPKYKLLVENLLANKYEKTLEDSKDNKKLLIAGFTNKKPGFCTISKDYHAA